MNSRLNFASVLGVVLLLGGCKVANDTQHPDTDPSTQVGSDRSDAAHGASLPIHFAASGVPHGAAISLIALDPSGRAALTRDLAGGVRLWPTLDGTREPIVVPVRDPRAMALAADDAGGWTLALVDASGGARIVGVDASGKSQPLASIPPTEFITDMLVLPGGRQLLAVGGDHIVHLFDARGVELDRIDKPGVRPASLRMVVDADGTPQVAAVTAGEFDGQQARFAVEVLPLEISEQQLALGTGQTVMLDSPPTIDNPSLSPDGRAAVFVQRQRLGSATWLVVAKQLADGVQTSLDSQLTLGVQPRLGLMHKGRALLDDGTGLGRVVDLQQRKVELVPLRSDPTISHTLEVFANGRRVGPLNNWLAVHDLATDELAYLGYEQLNINSASLSPSASAVAWSLADRVAVERITGEPEVFEIPGTRSKPQLFVGFLDEQRLAMLDWAGGLQVVRWLDGEILDSADLGSHINSAELQRAGEGQGVLLVRTNLWQNPLLVELLGGQIEGRYITQGASSLVGISSRRDRELDEWGVWLIDGSSKLHTFSLASLRGGIDAATALQHGESFVPGMPEQLAIASDGTQYWVRTLGTRPTLHADHGSDARELTLAMGFVVSLSLSPDASKIAVVQQRDPGQLLTVYEASSLSPLWAQPLPMSMALSWSDGGEALAVPANFGGVVFNTAEGSVAAARCSLAFERRFTPPAAQGLFNQLSVCEL